MLKLVLLVGLLKLVCIHAESICLNDCVVVRNKTYDLTNDMICTDDGVLCEYGHDCGDCGARWGVGLSVCLDDCILIESEIVDYAIDGFCQDRENYCEFCADQEHYCEYGHDCTDCGVRWIVDHEIFCSMDNITVIFDTLLLTPPYGDIYLGDPTCPANAITTDPLTGQDYYEFLVSNLTSCGITATFGDGYIIYSTDVMVNGVAALHVQCEMDTTQAVTIQIMANPCIVPVTIKGGLAADLAMTWFSDDSYNSLQPDDQYVNACEDTKIYIGIELIGDLVLDVAVFIKNCTITGTAAGATEVQTFTIVEEYGCPVDEYGFMIDANSNNTHVLFCFNPYEIVNDIGITVFDLTCDVVLCEPGEPGCTQDCDGVPGRFKKSTHLTNINTNPMIGGPFILKGCT